MIRKVVNNFICVVGISLFSLTYSETSLCLDKFFTSGPYITLEEGISFRDKEPYGNGSKKFKTGINSGIALGYSLNKFIKLEGEFDCRENAIKILTDTIITHPITATELSLSYMLNAYLSPLCWNNFIPYVGGGIGYTDTKFALHTNLFPPPSFSHAYSDTDHFSYQFMGGISYALAYNVSATLEYRYFKVPKLTYLNVDSRLVSNDLLFKLTYMFNSFDQRCYCKHDCFTEIYFAIEGGVSDRKTGAYSSGTKSFQDGPILGAAVGFNVRNKMRIEEEFYIRQNTVKIIQLGINNHDRPTGDENTYAYMTNIYISPFSFNNFIPYVGAGIGYAQTTYAIHVNVPPNPPAFAHPRLSDSDLAFQGMAGISYALARNVFIAAEYRYFRVNDMRYQQINGSKINSYISANTGLLRLTYQFPR